MKIESFDKEKSVVITTMGQKLVRELQSTTQKETLEEAAENYGWRIKRNSFSDKVKANELAESAQQDFIEGANWQAERMYSEEEVLELLIMCPHGYSDVRVEWFEKFKKK